MSYGKAIISNEKFNSHLSSLLDYFPLTNLTLHWTTMCLHCEHFQHMTFYHLRRFCFGSKKRLHKIELHSVHPKKTERESIVKS